MEEETVINNTREAAYYVDPIPHPYESIYGYKKHGFFVHRLKPGEAFDRSHHNSGTAYGYIKEERVGDENGNVVTVVFYSRMDSWRSSGKLRFFASPEALLIAMGKTPIVNRGNTEEAKAKLDKLGRQSPNATLPMMYLGNVELNPAAALEYRANPMKALPAPNGANPKELADSIVKLITDSWSKTPAPKKKARKAKKAAPKPRAPAKKIVKKSAVKKKTKSRR